MDTGKHKAVSALEVVLEQLEERVHSVDDRVSALEPRVEHLAKNQLVLFERTSKGKPALLRAERFVTKNQNLIIAVLVFFALLGGVPGIQAIVALMMK